MLLVVLISVASSLLYGVSDFLGALAARRSPVLVVTALAYLFATLALTAGVLIVPGAWTSASILAGVAAGVSALVGFTTFYAAMAAGPISLLSPPIAMLESAVPIAVALALGERLTGVGWLGVTAAIGAALLLGVPREARQQGVDLRALALSTVAGVSLGLSIIALDAAPAGSGLGPVLVEVVSGLLLLGLALLVLVLLRGTRVRVTWLDGHGASVDSRHHRSRTALLAASAGLVLGVANALLMLALRDGELSVVAVVAGLYPLATIVLARVVLRERLSRSQGVGIALALAACGLLTAG
ncbi:EamA family transporter [Cellulomonas sp. KRMCY2]|uniref:EamA family transporter n=1 Tax=Cellulomonas sp. KRMCY2 TaxID=1304865 RepID=UPI00045EB92E|nr:EamA family transporter [Cellulomonas sp. KRMCY2]